MIQGASLSFAFEPNAAPLAASERAELLVNPGFGRVFTDHMAVIRYAEGKGWHDARITARAPIQMDPASSVLHYAQEIFEGLKAYRLEDGGTALFRADANARRFRDSARRLAMPELPEELFLESIRALVRADREWIPTIDGGSLYLRPFMFASEVFLGVKPSSEYLYMVIASSVGAYFKGGAPSVSLWVSQEYTRAAPGGTGAAKCGGNYAASLLAQSEAIRHGCDQVVFLDAVERRWIEELGGMNIFFVFDDGTMVTPPLTGTILPGITRDSLLTLARGALFPRSVARRCGERPAHRKLRLRNRRGGHADRQRRQPRRQVHDRRRRPGAVDAEAPLLPGRHPARPRARSAQLGAAIGLTLPFPERQAPL